MNKSFSCEIDRCSSFGHTLGIGLKLEKPTDHNISEIVKMLKKVSSHLGHIHTHVDF